MPGDQDESPERGRYQSKDARWSPKAACLCLEWTMGVVSYRTGRNRKEASSFKPLDCRLFSISIKFNLRSSPSGGSSELGSLKGCVWGAPSTPPAEERAELGWVWMVAQKQSQVASRIGRRKRSPPPLGLDMAPTWHIAGPWVPVTWTGHCS